MDPLTDHLRSVHPLLPVVLEVLLLPHSLMINRIVLDAVDCDRGLVFPQHLLRDLALHGLHNLIERWAILGILRPKFLQQFAQLRFG